MVKAMAAARAAGLAAVLAGLGMAFPVAAGEPKVQTVAHGLVHPWGLAALPDGRLLVTERPGRMRLIGPDGRLSAPLAGLPAVTAGGQGGLLDVVIDPDFERTRRVYWTFSEAGADGLVGTAVARGRLEAEPGRPERLADVAVIFRQVPKVSGRLHFGARLAFARDGTLFVTLGDRFSRAADAQGLDTHLGKIVRITTDGAAPPDNPFVGTAGARAEIWSYGHRNVQGAALHPATGELWATEHGPQGGDELNRVQRGRNHGWPVITHGRNYGSGTTIGSGTERADVVPALKHWVPVSVAPSGMAFVTSDRHPGWKGSLLLGTLRGQALLRLTLDGERVVGEERLLTSLNERIRDVRQAPDGSILLLTDNEDGRVLRLLP